MRHLLVFLLSLTTLIATSHGSQRLRDFTRVVIADDAPPVQKAAAEELANYAGKITGKSLAVVSWQEFTAQNQEGLSFFVGEDAAARAMGGKPLAPWLTEEWLIKTLPNGMALAGHDDKGDAWSGTTPAGSMLAVYTLLDDHLGVHWFWPGDSGEHVPKNPEATVPELDLRKTPTFMIRSVSTGYGSYHNETFRTATRKWARRARLAWVRSAVFGHSWYSAFNLRDDESFKKHPEWFALVNGKRRPPQMCTTNPEVIDRMVEYVLNGKADIMNISPSDGGFFCECARCQALDVPGVLAYDNKHVQLSDRIFTYANEVARRVREKNPDKGCGMFAYTFYNRPPLKIAKLEPNLYLSFVFQSAAQRNPENLAEWRKNVSGWKQLGAKMVVREGWGNHYYFDLPFLHQDQIIANLGEAHELGFMAAYGEGSKNFATMAPNYWAMTRMMWDPARDRSKLMPEFYRTAYGPAAAEMQAFFESYSKALDANWAKMVRNVDTTGIAYANIAASWHLLLPEATVDEAEKHLRAAEAIESDERVKERIRLHRFGQDYAHTMLALLDAYRQLSIAGVRIDTFSGIIKERKDVTAEKRAALLKRAYELGEKREQLLLAHLDWPGPDEGLYAFTNDNNMRQWHATVKKELGIDKPTILTKALLKAK